MWSPVVLSIIEYEYVHTVVIILSPSPPGGPHLLCIADKKKHEQESITPNFVECGVWPISAPQKSFLRILHRLRAPH